MIHYPPTHPHTFWDLLDFFPHLCGVLVFDSVSRRLLRLRHLRRRLRTHHLPPSFTYHLSHTIFVNHHLSHTIFHTLSLSTIFHPPSFTHYLCQPPSFTHHLSHTIFVNHHLSHTIFHTLSLSTTIFHILSSHTFFHTLSFTHFLSHTIFHTPSFTHHLCQPPSFTHHLSHTFFVNHLSPTIFHIFVNHHLSRSIFKNIIFHTLSFTHFLSHTIFHTHHLCQPPSFTHHLLLEPLEVSFLLFRCVWWLDCLLLKKMWEGEVLRLSYSASVFMSCQLHWVIELKHSTESQSARSSEGLVNVAWVVLYRKWSWGTGIRVNAMPTSGFYRYQWIGSLEPLHSRLNLIVTATTAGYLFKGLHSLSLAAFSSNNFDNSFPAGTNL